MAFEDLKTVVNNLKRVDADQIVIDLMTTPESKKFIIRMNTQGQLFQLGEDSRGIRLDTIGGGYSALTKQIKSAINSPIDRVTLNDTGAFYDSWRVTKEGKAIIITANPIKDDDNLFDRWGMDVVGLQEGNLYRLIDAVLEQFGQEIKKSIQP